jgi:hypothetical protein
MKRFHVSWNTKPNTNAIISLRTQHVGNTHVDVDQPTNISKDSLHISNKLMTRSKTKTLKEAFQY